MDQRKTLKKVGVAFRDSSDHKNVRIADDDVDSVQHLDLSVIDDPNHEDTALQNNLLVQRIQMDTERALMQIDEYDFKNKNMKPKQLLLRPNRAKIHSLQQH